MEQLREQFERTSTVLKNLLQKTQQGIFLSQEDQVALHNAVDALYQEQVRTQMLLGENAESVSSIQETELLLAQQREKEQRCQQLRQLAVRFQSLQALAPQYQSELENFQARLAAYGDEELQRLEADGELEPYRSFLACIQLEHPDYDKDVEPLIAFFGMALPLGIMGKKIILPSEETISQSEATPISKKKAEQKSFPPITDLTVLGVLKKQGSRKQPKGVKTLSNMCFDSVDLRQIVFEFLESQYIVSAKYPVSRTEAAIDCQLREKLLESLTKEGYVLRCNLEGNTDQILYNITEVGRQIFSKVAGKFKFQVKVKRDGRNIKENSIECNITQMKTAADFIRVLENRCQFSKAFELDALFGFLYEKTGVSFIQIAKQEDAPTLALIFPAALFTESDPESNLCDLLDQLDRVAKNAAPDCKIFLASVDQEACAGWGDYLRSHLPADAEIFCGIIGEDHFASSDGTTLSLSDYLQELNAQYSDDTIPNDGSQCQHIPGEAVQEDVMEPTCTEEGRCDEVIRCKTCGAELSRKRKSLPKKESRTCPGCP